MRIRAVLATTLMVLGAGAPNALADQAWPVAGFDARAIDAVAQRAMAEWNVPGMAIGVVYRGETLYAKGLGIRELGQAEPVDTDTLFRIASASKAFTSAAVALLVEQGRLSWDDPVIEHIPELRMHEPWVTANLTITDLLAHRSGLMPHAGDLLLWPVPNEFTKDDIIHALRYFPLERGFRAGYSYDNLLYIVAGEVVARVAGQAWGSFVDQEIMRPLGMRRCFAGSIPKRQMRNLAVPHGEVEGELVTIDRNRVPAEPTKFAPAGGIVCSLADMLTWVRLQLGQGALPEGPRLFSGRQARTMWSPHNWLGVGQKTFELHRTNFSAYGLGWRIRDVFGYREVSHTGSLDGLRAHVLMVPEIDLGIVVLTNGSSTVARSAVMYTIEHAFLPVQQRDWVETYLAMEAEAEAAQAVVAGEAIPEVPTPLRAPSLPLAAYAGTYRDPWFGDVTIANGGEALDFTTRKSPRLSGPLVHHGGDRFIVQWADRSLEMDAYVQFHADEHGQVTAMSMKRLGGDPGDPDHFRLLDFKRIPPSTPAAGE
jgi:CubicO group peptidase (beta-lactamase class C family)